MSDNQSVISSLSDDEDRIADMLANDSMYYVLSQFLETDDNKNITEVLDDIARNLNEIRKLLTEFVKKQ